MDDITSGGGERNFRWTYAAAACSRAACTVAHWYTSCTPHHYTSPALHAAGVQVEVGVGCDRKEAKVECESKYKKYKIKIVK